MNGCHEVKEFLHDWVDGELEENLEHEIEVHLETCLDCRSQADAISRVKQVVAVKARHTPVPAGLEGRVREALAAERPGNERATPGIILRWNWVRGAAAVVLVAAACVSAVVLGPGFGGKTLAHAVMAREALKHHRTGSTNWRPGCGRRALDCLESLGLPRELPDFPETAMVRGLGTSDFGGGCKPVHVHYEFKDQSGSFSLFIVPAKISLGADEVMPEAWHAGCCLCVRGESNSVICFPGKGVHYSVVIDGDPEAFHKKYLGFLASPPVIVGPGSTEGR